jgi:hypothetical protein
MIARNRTRTLKTLGGLLLGLSLALGSAMAQQRPCALSYVTGDWFFVTDVGQQAIFPADGDITAIGTLKIQSSGAIGGKFDATVSEFAFLPGIDFNGAISVNSDCTGTVNFVTSAGTSRTDSIVVVSADEILGMSRDINNLWTYSVRRISRGPGLTNLAAKLDAIMRRLGLVPEGFGNQ